MIRWKDYVGQFKERYDALKDRIVESDSTECGPFLKSTGKPNMAPWTMDWAVIFADGNYVRVKEAFRQVAKSKAGERHHLSYHYGPAGATRDNRGIPVTDDAPPAELRIDEDRWGRPHIHMNSKAHIYQDRIIGYTIRDADVSGFLEAVIEHRRTNKLLTELLNIKVRK